VALEHRIKLHFLLALRAKAAVAVVVEEDVAPLLVPAAEWDCMASVLAASVVLGALQGAQEAWCQDQLRFTEAVVSLERE